MDDVMMLFDSLSKLHEKRSVEERMSRIRLKLCDFGRERSQFTET